MRSPKWEPSTSKLCWVTALGTEVLPNAVLSNHVPPLLTSSFCALHGLNATDGPFVDAPASDQCHKITPQDHITGSRHSIATRHHIAKPATDFLRASWSIIMAHKSYDFPDACPKGSAHARPILGPWIDPGVTYPRCADADWAIAPAPPGPGHPDRRSPAPP